MLNFERQNKEMKLNREELKEFLDEKVDQYNRYDFVEYDPVSIPHLYKGKEDIEISGFLTATIAWGNRTMILRNAKRMMAHLGNSPYDFILHHDDNDLEAIEGPIHRTFNSTDFIYFIRALRNIYESKNGLESIFNECQTENGLQSAIHRFKNIFFELPHRPRTTKHISDPMKGSAAKKINLFLRWMVRQDKRGVDFGLWKGISPCRLKIPLDLHTGNTARKLGLLTRRQNDWQAACELTEQLKQYDPNDPVRYDYALFGLGAFEGF